MVAGSDQFRYFQVLVGVVAVTVKVAVAVAVVTAECPGV
jgi:hypothetical protein